MSHEEFEPLVKDALSSLPREFQEALSNVDIVVEDQPSDEQRRRMHLRPWVNLFGLYEGVPKTQRRNYSMVLPDKITIFKNAIVDSFGDDEAIKEQVRRTVFHEIGHHLGMDDKKLRKLRY